MRFTILPLVALPFMASAAPTSTSSAVASQETGAYTVMALRSASPIHFEPMNAANLSFYLGGKTQSYCPQLNVSGFSCPAGNQTVFMLPYNSLDTEVPGGQSIYVAPSGELGFTQAHSGYYPVGSVLDPIIYTPVNGQAFTGTISTTAFNATGFMACPTTNGNYQVFANMANGTVPMNNTEDCLGFDAVTNFYNGPLPAAWQYD